MGCDGLGQMGVFATGAQEEQYVGTRPTSADGPRLERHAKEGGSGTHNGELARGTRISKTCF